jgi:voltage-dependent calcium channel L type alpha-1D
VFVVEMLLKFLGLGIKAYLIDTFNVFDGCIALLCMVELAVYSSMNKQFSSHPAVNFFKALRVLRVLRVAKIVRKWKKLRSTVNKMVVSLKNIGTFSLLLLLFLFVFSLLGMQLFAKYSFRDRDEKIVQRKFLVERFAVEPLVAIREGFDNIYLAANTLYLVIMNYRWNWIMYENLLSIGDRWPAYSVFFVVVHLVGSKVVFALFTAFLL